MSDPGAVTVPAGSRTAIVATLGTSQTLAWASSYYLPAILADPISVGIGIPRAWFFAAVSLALLIAAFSGPSIGRIIDRHGGRGILALSNLVLAVGLVALAMTTGPVSLFAAWAVLGLGMGTGLYDAVFAALGRMYGHGARGPITNLTLFGGFASTVCWPLSAWLIEAFGWRGACFVYAALHLAVSLPLQVAVVRPQPSAAPVAVNEAASGAPEEAPPIANETRIFILLALVQSIAAAIGSIVVVHLLIFLQARGLDFAAAVALGTLFGPAQVGARVVERIFGSRYHPVWTLIAAGVLMAAGLALLLGRSSLLALVILVYGAGYGITWIARGTLPLALFGPVRFPRLMGRLAFPSLIVQALAPSAGALLIETSGADATIAVLTGLAAVILALIAMLWASCRARLAAEP
jgi:MFS family permease